MKTISISQPEGYLYIVTDSHLDQQDAPYTEFIAMLSQLKQARMLICLGDLFKVWLALPKFWAEANREVMQAFKELQQRGVEIVFVIGNREVLLPRTWNDYWRTQFPFTYLIHDDVYITWGEHRYGFIHGDTINSNDHSYLRWRKIVRSLPFEWFFRAMPSPVARWIAGKLEATLAETNQEFKISFPEKEVEHFAETVLHDVDFYFVGHFHQNKEIQVPQHPGTLKIVPDWLSCRAVLQLDSQGKLHTLYFDKESSESKAK